MSSTKQPVPPWRLFPTSSPVLIPMPTVVDDATLIALLSGRASVTLAAAAAAGEVLTTGSWYYRLHRAIHDPGSAGSLSTMVANLPAPAKEVLYLRLDDLPPEIVLLGLRVVVPVMGALRVSRRVNHLTAEAHVVAMRRSPEMVTDGASP